MLGGTMSRRRTAARSGGGRAAAREALHIATAESCWRLLASRLTDVPGSSDYVDRGVVCYSNASKVELLGVPEALIAEHGAVSGRWRARWPTASGAAPVGVGIGVTESRGPTAGPDKPVGTVAIAVARHEQVQVRTFRFIGGREMVKFRRRRLR